MRNGKQTNKVKGFTLIEMIIVLAIIGILAGILVPAMATYYRKARIKDANANAKMAFNAAQTVAQTYISKDRALEDRTNPVTASMKSALTGTLIISYNAADGSARYADSFGVAWSSMTPIKSPSGSGFVPGLDDAAQMIVDKVNRTVSDGSRMCWTVVIDNYIVKGAIAADSLGTNRVGYYSANNAKASDTTNFGYDQWLSKETSGAGVPATLKEVCTVYDLPAPTEATT